MRYEVLHTTTFTHEAEVSASHHVARLTPRACPGQVCLEHGIEISPAPQHRAERTDYFGNLATTFSLEVPYRVLRVTARTVIERAAHEAELGLEGSTWEQARSHIQESQAGTPQWNAREFTFSSPLVARSPVFAQYARGSFEPGRSLDDAAADLTRRIHQDFAFDPEATTIATPLDDVFRMRRGVCQDFAHLAIACLRSLGLAARYVSGYIETVPAQGSPKLVGVDASHAWISVFSPTFGWIDFDPTNNLRPGDRHVTAAWGRDFSDISPLRGVFVGSGRHALAVAVDVNRVG